MIYCPKCNEVIGDDVHKCPFCRHEITEEERRNIAKEKEMANREATIEAMEEYSRRMRNWFIASAIWAVTALVVMLIVILCNLAMVWYVLIFLLLMAAYLVCVYKLHLAQCPYCEQFMRTNIFNTTHCPRCGGKLR